MLCEMKCSQANRAEGFDEHTRRPQRRTVFRRDVERPERVVQQEYANPRCSPIYQDLAQRVGHPSGVAVIQLERDGLSR